MLTVGTDSYISEADASAYLTLMGLDPLESAEALLKRATVAIDRIYGTRFIGSKTASTQPLLWPRTVDDSIDSDGSVRDFADLPTELAHATVEMAVLLNSGTSVFAVPEPQVTKESFDLGGIKESREFGTAHTANHLHTVALTLRPLLAPPNVTRLVRG